MRLRHLAGVRLLVENGDSPQHPEPAFDALPEADVLPEIRAEDVTPELLRAGILRDGCLLVRGLVDRDAALHFAEQIDRAFAERGEARRRRQRRRGLLRGVRRPGARSRSPTAPGCGCARAAVCWRPTRRC